MKLNLVALVTILGCTTKAALASTCSESSGICVCSGECPSFTNSWGSTGSENDNCVAMKDGGTKSMMDGVITVNGETYDTVDPCTSALGDNAAGLFGTYYASVVVAAAAVVGVAAL